MLIGIGGGTGSGKTFLALKLQEEFGERKVIIIEQDAYYKDLSHLTLNQRLEKNFDHPDAIDFNLLYDHLNKLIDNQPVNIPIYDFSTHTRRKETKEIQPHPAILLEGIMVLTNARLRNMMNMRIFVETDPDIRFIRRLERDMLERNRTLKHIIKQYKSTVKPMHEQFVEITKKYADIILTEGSGNDIAVNRIKTKIQLLLKGMAQNN